MSDAEPELEARIEAALYAAGRPLAPEDLARAAGTTSSAKAARLTRRVARRISQALRAVEIVELDGPKFAMQLRPTYQRVARRFATRPLVPYAVLKTLSYIVYFQPISASDVAARRGTQAYTHLKTLEDLGFVGGERQGRTRVYRSTALFADYFGLSPDPQVMKQQLARGIPTRPAA